MPSARLVNHWQARLLHPRFQSARRRLRTEGFFAYLYLVINIGKDGRCERVRIRDKRIRFAYAAASFSMASFEWALTVSSSRSRQHADCVVFINRYGNTHLLDLVLGRIKKGIVNVPVPNTGKGLATHSVSIRLFGRPGTSRFRPPYPDSVKPIRCLVAAATRQGPGDPKGLARRCQCICRACDRPGWPC